MHPLLDPKLDVVFKLLFTRHDDAHEALIGLLTAVLRPNGPIVAVEILDATVGLDDVDDKSIVLDVRVRFRDGTTLNVEMQARNLETFRNRLLYCCSANGLASSAASSVWAKATPRYARRSPSRSSTMSSSQIPTSTRCFVSSTSTTTLPTPTR